MLAAMLMGADMLASARSGAMLALCSDYSHDPGSYDYLCVELHSAMCRSLCLSIALRDEVLRRAVRSTPLRCCSHAVAGTGADV